MSFFSLYARQFYVTVPYLYVVWGEVNGNEVCLVDVFTMH